MKMRSRFDFCDCSKQTAILDSTCFHPAIERLLDPEWNGHRSNMPGLSMEVGNQPMIFSELNGRD